MNPDTVGPVQPLSNLIGRRIDCDGNLYVEFAGGPEPPAKRDFIKVQYLDYGSFDKSVIYAVIGKKDPAKLLVDNSPWPMVRYNDHSVYQGVIEAVESVVNSHGYTANDSLPANFGYRQAVMSVSQVNAITERREYALLKSFITGGDEIVLVIGEGEIPYLLLRTEKRAAIAEECRMGRGVISDIERHTDIMLWAAGDLMSFHVIMPLSMSRLSMDHDSFTLLPTEHCLRYEEENGGYRLVCRFAPMEDGDLGIFKVRSKVGAASVITFLNGDRPTLEEPTVPDSGVAVAEQPEPKKKRGLFARIFGNH